LSLVAFQDDISFAFLFNNFVWRTYGTPWLEMAAHGKLGQVALDASQALSQSYFGGEHRQDSIRRNGIVKYSYVMRSLMPELGDSGREGFEALIVPILILLLHSVSW
jgi:hypothetical protein